jgi:hypothetical protein
MATPGFSLDTHPAQGANSHLVANENYVWLEALTGVLNAVDFNATAPIASPAPAEGDLYVLALSGCTGAFASHDGQLALYLGGAWQFRAPVNGLRVRIATNAPSTTISRGQIATYIQGRWGVDVATTVAPVNYDQATGTGNGRPEFLELGSRWLDVVGKKEYVCVQSGALASEWKETTASGGTGTGDPDQNIWLNVAGDTGSTTANSTADTLTIAGSATSGHSTSVSGDTVTVEQAQAHSGQSGYFPSFDYYVLMANRSPASRRWVNGFGSVTPPASPTHGATYILGDGTRTGAWAAGSAGQIAVYESRAGQWLFFSPDGGERAYIPHTVLEYQWDVEVYPDFRGREIAYNNEAGRWYPVQDLASEVAHFTGRWTANGEQIWAKHIRSPFSWNWNTSQSYWYTVPAHGVSIWFNEPSRVTGVMYKTSNPASTQNAGYGIAMPQLFSGSALQCYSTQNGIYIRTDSIDPATYSFDMRLEYVPNPNT